MSKRIIAVEFNFPNEAVDELDFVSDRSVLDADIIVFQPELPFQYGHSGESYSGQPVLEETESFRVKEAAKHWRSELKAALADGKTIVVYACKPSLVQVYTGRRETSGTGRNQKVMNIVEPFSTYYALPLPVREVVPRGGTDIKFVSDLGPIKGYWETFADVSSYQVYFDIDGVSPLLTTKTGKRTVGGIVLVGPGALVVLPPPEFDWDELYEETEDGVTIRPNGLAIGAQLTEALIEMDRAIKAGRTSRQRPAWAESATFASPLETHLRRRLAEVDSTIVNLQNERLGIEAQIAAEERPKRLLYDAGSSLEDAVIEALREFGFVADRLREGESEFDVVFESPEGRFLGEVEGKEGKAVNIDKLSQLERNLQEDFARDGVEAYAHGILFANAFLLVSPEERHEDFFTQKCLSGAKRSGVGLVRTPDLFDAVLAIRRGADDEFKQACRKAFAEARGSLVSLPRRSA
jgi:hypothetical protein